MSLSDSILPRDCDCPYCGAIAGQPCHTVRPNWRFIYKRQPPGSLTHDHSARWAAVVEANYDRQHGGIS